MSEYKPADPENVRMIAPLSPPSDIIEQARLHREFMALADQMLSPLIHEQVRIRATILPARYLTEGGDIIEHYNDQFMAFEQAMSEMIRAGLCALRLHLDLDPENVRIDNASPDA